VIARHVDSKGIQYAVDIEEPQRARPISPNSRPVNFSRHDTDFALSTGATTISKVSERGNDSSEGTRCATVRARIAEDC
jgi:hypothetical protein